MDTDPPGKQVPEATLTIGALARRTGLTAATIRMWEARHGFPDPVRQESGHRRYRERDVEAIAAVVRRKDAGLRLELAIAQVLADAEPAAPSVYAHLRRRHPHLGVHRLRKSTLLALSWAIEDEFCAKADRAHVFGSFQDERHYRAAQPRWTELAAVAADATVLAGFARTDTEASPVEVALDARARMRREWMVACAAPDLPVVLTAWELPGQSGTRDRDRLFESIWSVDHVAVYDAARVCAGVARSAGYDAVVPEAPPGGGDGPDLGSVTTLFNRMVAYVDRIGA